MFCAARVESLYHRKLRETQGATLRFARYAAPLAAIAFACFGGARGCPRGGLRCCSAFCVRGCWLCRSCFSVVLCLRRCCCSSRCCGGGCRCVSWRSALSGRCGLRAVLFLRCGSGCSLPFACCSSVVLGFCGRGRRLLWSLFRVGARGRRRRVGFGRGRRVARGSPVSAGGALGVEACVRSWRWGGCSVAKESS